MSREIKRNGGLGGYRANQADRRVWDRARHPKAYKLVVNRTLADRCQQTPFPERAGPLDVPTGEARLGGKTTERAAAEDTQLQNTCAAIS